MYWLYLLPGLSFYRWPYWPYGGTKMTGLEILWGIGVTIAIVYIINWVNSVEDRLSDDS